MLGACGETNHEEQSLHEVKVLCNHVVRVVELNETGRIQLVKCK